MTSHTYYLGAVLHKLSPLTNHRQLKSQPRRWQLSQTTSSPLIFISFCSLLLLTTGSVATESTSSMPKALSTLAKTELRTRVPFNTSSRIRRQRMSCARSTNSACFIQPLSTQTVSFAKTPPTPQHHHNDKCINSRSTALHLKFKSFDEMLLHHHASPILIDFYAPWCGPCKMMKGELSNIRERLDKLNLPTSLQKQEEKEDCGVEEEDDVAAVSATCIDNGVDSNINHADEASEKEEDESATPNSKQSSGIPVYHVNTNKFPQVGAKNSIHGLPTLVLFYEGEELWRNEGIIMGDDIMDVLLGLQEGGWKKVTYPAPVT